ncbi:hypothetical protein B0H14DRAFT_2580195 [Mycena olivaceomarginata]|nr:hypothetical protein B0H14DRAFT_2580195 [Mycena olivaceomarginata]
MTGKREGHPCCGLHMSDEGVEGARGKTGYPLLHSYWIAFDRVGVWIKLTLVKQHREEGGAGGSSCCRLHSGNRLGRYTGVHLMEMECYIVVGGVGGRTAKQYRKAGGAGDTHVKGHN